MKNGSWKNWSTLALACVLCLQGGGCSLDSPPVEDESLNGSVSDFRSALSIANRYAERHGGLVIEPSAVVDADYVLHHLRFLMSREGLPPQKLAVHHSGEVMDHDRALRELALQHRATWGVLSIDFVHDHRDAQTELPVLVWFADVPARDAWLAQPRSDVSTKLALGESPAAQVRASFSTIAVLAREGAATTISYSPPFDLEPTANPSDPHGTGVAKYTGSGASFNNAGLYGKGQRIGLIDGFFGRNLAAPAGTVCAINHMHDAFKYASIQYQRTPTACTNDTQCGLCGRSGGTGKCVQLAAGQKRCLSRTNSSWPDHAGMVASRIAQTVGTTKYHAAEANIVVSNDLFVDYYVGVDTSDQYFSIAAIDATYNFFATANPKIEVVAEAYQVSTLGGGNSFYNAVDHVRDWYSRHRGLTSIKSAGNSGAQMLPDNAVYGWYCSPPAGPQARADCHSLNSICVGSTYSAQTYATYLDDSMSCFSLYGNPFTSGGSNPKDAERPDLVSEGTSALVARTYDFTSGQPTNAGWAAASGTSFATGAIAGLTALLREKCKKNGITLDSLLTRAILRNTAFERQALEGSADAPIYPTPGFVPPGASSPWESRAGAGLPTGENLYMYCNPGGGSGQHGVTVGMGSGRAETGTWSALPAWMAGAVMDPEYVANAGEWDQLPGALKAGSLQRSTTNLFQRASAAVGDRLRVSMSFLTCPGATATNPTTELGPAVDFDLVACGRKVSTGANNCMAVSQSFDDTNEGFDIVFRDAHTDVEVFIVRPTGATGCSTGPNPGEPYSYAWAYWTN